jgi:alpha-tubulin suppressor-like RCC1 family protein
VDMKIATNSSAATVYVRTSTGRLYAWGYNHYGQLGVGNKTSSGTPQITLTDNVVDFWTVGGHSTCVYVLKTDGNIYGCGYNGYGQLGFGDTTDRSTWELIPGLINKNITKMFMNGYEGTITAYALSDDKKLYVAGYNGYGQTGLGHTSTQKTFTQSHTPSTPVQFRSYTSAYGNGKGYAVYTDSSGQLFGCGNGSYRLFDDEGEAKFSWTKIAGRL